MTMAGVGNPGVKAVGQQTKESRQNEVTAYELRVVEHWTWRAIAEHLGYQRSDGTPNETGAYKAYKRAISRIPQEALDEMRENIYSDQRRMLAGLVPIAAKGSAKGAAQAALAADRIHQTMATIFGLARPAIDGVGGALGKRIIIVEADSLPALALPEPMSTRTAEGEVTE
jgi:hypothetical protein